MPSHIHVYWEILEMNGKEKPSASFLKHTSHQMQKITEEYKYLKYIVHTMLLN